MTTFELYRFLYGMAEPGMTATTYLLTLLIDIMARPGVWVATLLAGLPGGVFTGWLVARSRGATGIRRSAWYAAAMTSGFWWGPGIPLVAWAIADGTAGARALARRVTGKKP